MEDNKQALRSLIKEILGHYMPLGHIAEKYARMVMNLMAKESNGGNKKLNFFSNLHVSEPLPEDEESASGIGHLDIDIFPKEETGLAEINVVKGEYNKKNTKQYQMEGKFNYPVYINLYITNWDYKTDVTSEIKNSLSHELFHAFEHIKEIDGNNYSKALNNVRNDVKGLKYDGDIQELKDFMEIFYLSLPNEVTARIHQSYEQMKQLKLNFYAKNYEEILEELNKLSVFRDFLRVQFFGESSVLMLPDEIKSNFVKNFNVKLKEYKNKYKTGGIKIIENPDEFFKYWIGRAKRMSLEARHKIVSQAISLFSEKPIVTEYNNKKFNSYREQLYEEILQNIDGAPSNDIYRFSISNTICEYIEDCFWKEVDNYSNFEI